VVSQQSGSDVNPVAVDSGLFKGNTGAIGGTVTDQTGAVVPGAKIDVESESGDAVESAITKDDGTYVVSDLAPGFYKVRVDANGFMSFYLTDSRCDVVGGCGLRVGRSQCGEASHADSIRVLGGFSAGRCRAREENRQWSERKRGNFGADDDTAAAACI
jgi:hypothetical protein